MTIEPGHAWIAGRGNSGARGTPGWEILRFDGEALHLEVYENWHEARFVDVDDDGSLEILSKSVYHVNCYYCGLAALSFDLHRWDRTRMVNAGLEPLPAGAASDELVTANNRAVALGGAGRWAEAAAVVADARPLGAGHAVFRRNAALIDLYAGPGSEELSGTRLLAHILAGRWAEAVDIFRDDHVLPDFFAEPPYPRENGEGTPPFLLAVFEATERPAGWPRPGRKSSSCTRGRPSTSTPTRRRSTARGTGGRTRTRTSSIPTTRSSSTPSTAPSASRRATRCSPRRSGWCPGART